MCTQAEANDFGVGKWQAPLVYGLAQISAQIGDNNAGSYEIITFGQQTKVHQNDVRSLVCIDLSARFDHPACTDISKKYFLIAARMK